MRVHCRVQYLTGGVQHMRGEDYDATLLVHAVKGHDIRQYCTVRIGGQWVTIRESNKDRALEWFAEWAAPLAAAASPVRKVLVPIPNRSAFIGSGTEPRTAAMARAIQAVMGEEAAICADILRWSCQLPRSTDAASRNPVNLFPSLELTGDIPWGTIILVDDVFTSGGHAVASAWRLQQQGRTAQMLVCCGRTTWAQLDDPFSVPQEELDIPPLPAIG